MNLKARELMITTQIIST